MSLHDDPGTVKARPPFPGLCNALRDLAPMEHVPLDLHDEAPRDVTRGGAKTLDEATRAEGKGASLPVPRESPLPPNQRLHTRFDKAFLVLVGSELYGDSHAIARNISAGGVLVEMCYAPPLGSLMTVHFRHPREDGHFDEIVARAEVKHHHYLNFTGGHESDSARAVGMRFIEFLDVPGAEPGLLH